MLLAPAMPATAGHWRVALGRFLRSQRFSHSSSDGAALPSDHNAEPSRGFTPQRACMCVHLEVPTGTLFQRLWRAPLLPQIPLSPSQNTHRCWKPFAPMQTLATFHVCAPWSHKNSEAHDCSHWTLKQGPSQTVKSLK